MAIFMKPIQQSVLARLDRLETAAPEHIKLGQLCMEADDGNVFSADLWVNAALKRSLQVLDGFSAMVRARNATCVCSPPYAARHRLAIVRKLARGGRE